MWTSTAIACVLTASVVPADVGEPKHCGLYSLYISAAALGRETPLPHLQEVLRGDEQESSLKDLRHAAEHSGFVSAGFRWAKSVPEFRRGEMAAILPVVNGEGRRHFVAAIESKEGQFLIVDFPASPQWQFQENLRRHYRWDGTALVIAPDEAALERAGEKSAGSNWPFLIASAAGAVFFLGIVLSARRPHPSRTAERSGFTILEVLVTIGVIGLLVALLLPAIQSARQSARRVDCSSRLHQIGLATQNYADVHRGTLPPALVRHIVMPEGRIVRRNLSSQARLLPYLEQSAVWQEIDLAETGDGADDGRDAPSSDVNTALLTRSVSVFTCPDDSVPPGGNSYRMCRGSSPGYYESPGEGANHALLGVARNHGCELSKISDGLSTTACFSERVVGDQNPGSYDPWRDRAILLERTALNEFPDEVAAACRLVSPDTKVHASFDGATWLLTAQHLTLYNHVLPPNSRTPDCHDGHDAVTARSHHAGGVHVLFCDGGVRLVGESVELAVWRGIASIDGGETITGF